MSEEERILIQCEDAKFNSLGRDAHIAAYCEVLSVSMDKPETVKHILRYFSIEDGFNLASYGEQEVLKVLREKISKDKDISLNLLMYLARKGNSDDIALLEEAIQSHATYVNQWDQKSMRREILGVLQERVERNFTVKEARAYLCDNSVVIPSVANTGPQGVYAYYILLKYGLIHGGGNIPDELLSMVVTFDEKGNPVSSVDLAKYGLSMPFITPKPDPSIMFYPNRYYFESSYGSLYTVIFPHEQAEGWTPPPHTPPVQQQAKEPPSPPDPAPEAGQPTEAEPTPPPPTHRPWLHIAIAVLIIGIGGFYAWRKVKQK
jgi:hypothetical protein